MKTLGKLFKKLQWAFFYLTAAYLGYQFGIIILSEL